jgi:hypothetical protein
MVAKGQVAADLFRPGGEHVEVDVTGGRSQHPVLVEAGFAHTQLVAGGLQLGQVRGFVGRSTTTSRMSTIGLAARPGTAVEPMCSTYGVVVHRDDPVVTEPGQSRPVEEPVDATRPLLERRHQQLGLAACVLHRGQPVRDRIDGPPRRVDRRDDPLDASSITCPDRPIAVLRLMCHRSTSLSNVRLARHIIRPRNLPAPPRWGETDHVAPAYARCSALLRWCAPVLDLPVQVASGPRSHPAVRHAYEILTDPTLRRKVASSPDSPFAKAIVRAVVALKVC